LANTLKHWSGLTLFVGSARGGETFTVLSSLINPAKLNNVDPEIWLADVRERIISGRREPAGHTLSVGLEG